MIEYGTAALIASSVALVVGLLGVGVTVWSTYRNRRVSLELQYAGERSKALVRVVQLMESSGRSAQDRIFNLLETRSDDDPVTGEPGNPYAPDRRPGAERRRADEADAAALIGAYGGDDIDGAFDSWLSTLEAIDRAFDVAKFNYFEGGQQAPREEFMRLALKEQSARGHLRDLIRSTIRVTRQRDRMRRGAEHTRSQPVLLTETQGQIIRDDNAD